MRSFLHQLKSKTLSKFIMSHEHVCNCHLSRRREVGVCAIVHFLLSEYHVCVYISGKVLIELLCYIILQGNEYQVALLLSFLI